MLSFHVEMIGSVDGTGIETRSKKYGFAFEFVYSHRPQTTFGSRIVLFTACIPFSLRLFYSGTPIELKIRDHVEVVVPRLHLSGCLPARSRTCFPRKLTALKRRKASPSLANLRGSSREEE